MKKLRLMTLLLIFSLSNLSLKEKEIIPLEFDSKYETKFKEIEDNLNSAKEDLNEVSKVLDNKKTFKQAKKNFKNNK